MTDAQSREVRLYDAITLVSLPMCDEVISHNNVTS
jgi:hypothetical protein